MAPAQHFLPEYDDNHIERQNLHVFKEENQAGPPDQQEYNNPDDLPHYKVTSMPNFNMKDKGTAEAEERDELIKENEAYLTKFRHKREAKNRLEKIKR